MKGQTKLGLLVVILGLVLGSWGAPDGNGTVIEEEDVETFEQVEKNFKSAIGNLVKKILPYIMEGGGNVDVSGPCKSSIMKVIGGVRQLREWAMRFLDATGKIPPGILEGTSLSIGDYDECLAIKVGKRDDLPKSPEEVIFRGQYCLLEVHKPEGVNRAIMDYQNGNKENAIAKTKTFFNMFIRYKHLTNSTMKFGACIPSKCSKEDLVAILNSDSMKFAGKVTVSYCKQFDDEEKSPEQLLLLCLFGLIFGIMVVGTIADAGLRLRKSDKSKDDPPYIKFFQCISKNTSLYTNALEVFNTNTKEGLRSLCGIRPIIVILTIYSHAYGHIHKLHFQKFRSAANFIKFFDSFTFSGIANGSVGVDSIFLIAGVTITYTRWRNMSEKSKINLGIWRLLLERYFRMSFAQLLTICVLLMFPLIGSGPFWNAYMDSELQNCRSRWWQNLLFVNNYMTTYDTCMYHTWVLAVIMQLTILACIIVWILKKSLRAGIFTMVILIISGVIAVGVVTIINRLPGSMAFFMLDIRTAPITWRDVYILPYDHIGPFCIGLMAGYFIAVKKDKLEIGRVTSVIIWCCSSSCACAVMFGMYEYRNGDPIDLTLAAFYAMMHRNVWSLCIAWLIIACATEHGGAVARVLHSDFWVPLDRLCYIAYILHIPIMFFHSAVLRERLFMGHFEILFMALGYISLSFVGAFFLYIIFAKPYFAIEDSITSYFQLKRKASFEPKINSGPMTSRPEEELDGIKITTSTDKCVNVAYSKKLDGL